MEDDMRKIRTSDTVFAQEVDGKMVLLDMKNKYYFELNDVGCLIWRIMQDKESLGEIYDGLRAAYDDVEPEYLRSDLLEFIEQLRSDGLLEIEE